jgi:hypothetical protein
MTDLACAMYSLFLRLEVSRGFAGMDVDGIHVSMKVLAWNSVRLR